MLFSTSQALEAIKPYEAGKPLSEVEREYGITNAVKLASNENPFGCSPTVSQAVMSALPTMHRYPEPVPFTLCEKLARKYHVHMDNLVVGNGSDDIIALLAHAFLDPGQEAVMPLPSFLMYEISVKTAKGVPAMVPLNDFTTNLDGLVKAVTPKTKMVFVTNPFNPTGAVITRDEFSRFSDQLPDNVLIIVDEAYIEFVRNDQVFNSLDNPLSDPRIVTLRTFSKAYGLAGFRIGYAVMDTSVAQILNRIRQPFNVNALAQVAAQAALEDTQFLSQTLDGIHQGIDFLTDNLTQLGLDVLPTQANFFMVDVKTDSRAVCKKMLKKGVVLRSLASYGYETFLRINAGTQDENQKCVDALAAVLGE